MHEDRSLSTPEGSAIPSEAVPSHGIAGRIVVAPFTVGQDQIGSIVKKVSASFSSILEENWLLKLPRRLFWWPYSLRKPILASSRSVVPKGIRKSSRVFRTGRSICVQTVETEDPHGFQYVVRRF
jgi:hypothetical protein